MDTAPRRLSERRAALRLQATVEHGIVSARVRPGYDAAVINVSASGILIETLCRLLPGARVELLLSGRHTRATSWGRVVRAYVVGVAATTVRYRGAVVLERPLSWPTDRSARG